MHTVFWKLHNLKRHRRVVHKREKLLRCPQCIKSFSLLGELRKHLRVHSGEEPYSCKNSFSLSNAMKAIMRVHTDEKPFNCSMCEKSFEQASALRRHLEAPQLQTVFKVICRCMGIETNFKSSHWRETLQLLFL
jgi:KRAB domain-containing zinc finger protein